ncbi:alkaline-phosphatase-like protein [Xylariales sp. PMI_506]|nr:alkaline-phosphatase-like protein [Xylariales sp. PMI_506]
MGKNILLMIADDLGRQLGSYGDPTCKTPHLDNLASEGVKFTNAFASTASCSGSRTTIYTGLHTHQNGMYGLNSHRHHFQTFDHVQSAPGIFSKELGYLTAIIGKIHVGPDTVYPWEVREESATRDVAFVADSAGAFFERAKADSRPFFLTIGFIDPHRDRTRDGFGNEHFDRLVPVKYRPEDVQVPEYLLDSPGTRQELANYYESITRLDHGVGLVLSELEKAGLNDDTLVIFLSDNGPPFINSKTTLYDAGVKLPLIIRSPGGTPSVENPNLISYVDILPTLLDYAGKKQETTDEANEKPTGRIGRSFLPILHETRDLPDWDHVYGSHTFHEVTNYWPTRYLRDRRFKYHRNIAHRLDFPFAADLYGSLAWEDVRNQKADPKLIGQRKVVDYFNRPPEELYDLVEDPYEVRNLAGDPAHAETLKAFRGRLEDWQRRTVDPWLYRDGVSVKFIQYHLDAGFQVPDRFDLDPAAPESIGPGVTYYENKGFGGGKDPFA